MSFLLKSANTKNPQEQIEERIKYFLKYQPSNNKKQKNLKRFQNNDNYSTLIDPINIKNEKIYQNVYSRNNNNNNINNNNNLNPTKDKLNESSLSTQTVNNIAELPIKKSVSIQVSKELAKYTEPKFKKTEFLKLPQKFSLFNENDKQNNITELNKNENNNNNKDKLKNRHRYTNSELELLETDEKVSQKQIEEITNNNISNLSLNSIEDIYTNNNILFIFHFLINIEKCYQELSKDLKGNGLKNLDYKLKVAYSYLNIIMDEKNLLSKIFLYNEDDINEFLIRELCLYLSVLFLDNFANELNGSNLNEFLTCHRYCHINLLYVIMLVIKKIEEAISENKIKFDENSLQYNDYQNCKSLIENSSDKINENKYKENFHTNNKIIKNIFLNILNIFRDINDNITQNILEIFNLSKTSKFRTIIINHIKTNFLINEKINEVLKKYLSPEDSEPKNNNNKNSEDYSQNEEDSKNTSPTQIIKEPFLPPKKKDDQREYCLVLDLDETLVHFFEDNYEAYVKVRMGAENFITVLSQFCEIVIFTASTKYYCNIVIEGLDCKNLIDYKLYREYTYDYNGINVKDLSKLGRDLTKIIIIDNIEENYIFQPNNGLNIIDFEGDENDNELQFLLQDLLEIVSVPGKNVLHELPRIRKNMQKRYSNMI